MRFSFRVSIKNLSIQSNFRKSTRTASPLYNSCFEQFLEDLDHEEKRHNISSFIRRIELSSADVSECIIVGAFGFNYQTPTILAICRPEDKEWSIVNGKTEDNKNFNPVDFVFSKGTLHVVDTIEHSENYTIKLTGREVNMKIIPSLPIEEDVIEDVGVKTDDFVMLLNHSYCFYLVESVDHEMLLIKKVSDWIQRRDDEGDDIDPWYPKTSSFYVFKMDPSTGEWHRLHSIDDQVLFISYGGSSLLYVKDVKGVQENCIYFAEDVDYYEYNLYALFCLASVVSFTYKMEELNTHFLMSTFHCVQD
ncbi:hypothetical protein DITRI_Ditri01bG0026600 [Diplodiscus trichospermus]